MIYYLKKKKKLTRGKLNLTILIHYYIDKYFKNNNIYVDVIADGFFFFVVILTVSRLINQKECGAYLKLTLKFTRHLESLKNYKLIISYYYKRLSNLLHKHTR